MKAIASLFHSISAPAPAEINSVRSSSLPSKTVDCVVILGPGLDGLAKDYEAQMHHSGLKAVIIGDGKGDISRDMIDRVRRSGAIGPTTQVICHLHGGIRSADGKTTHQLQIGDHKAASGQSTSTDRKIAISTREFLQWFRDPLKEEGIHAPQVDAWSGTIHLVSCMIGAIRKDNAISEASENLQTNIANTQSNHGNVILYGGNKLLSMYTAKKNLFSLFGYLSECKQSDARKPDIFEMFNRVKSGSMDTVVLLDGSLQQMQVARAPKTLLEVLPENQQALQRQYEMNNQLDLVNGGGKSVNNKPNQTTESLWRMLSEKDKVKVKHYFVVRLKHLKTAEKLQKFKNDLSIDPELANITVGSLTPLMLLANRRHESPGQTVRNSEIAHALIDAGANIHARDKDGMTAAHHAAKNGSTGVLSAIYDEARKAQASGKKTNIDARDYSGATVALHAAKAGNYQALEFLLDNQVRMEGVDTFRWGNLLHYACKAESDRFATVKCLLNKGAKSLINKRDLSGKTALHIAVMAGDAETVEALLEAGANPTQRTLGFNTPSDLARALKGEQGEKILRLLRNAKTKQAAPA